MEIMLLLILRHPVYVTLLKFLHTFKYGKYGITILHDIHSIREIDLHIGSATNIEVEYYQHNPMLITTHYLLKH